jgi:hypothetical protein
MEEQEEAGVVVAEEEVVAEEVAVEVAVEVVAEEVVVEVVAVEVVAVEKKNNYNHWQQVRRPHYLHLHKLERCCSG